jgi:hypothetical protein
MNGRFLSFLAALALALAVAPRAVGAQQSQPDVTLSTSRAEMAEAPQQVVLGNLPRISAAEAAVLSQVIPPAPRIPFSSQQYAAMKAAAASKTGTNQGFGSSAQIETPAPPSVTTSPGISTPSATAFGGLGSGCGLSFPPDMALAVNQQFVLQMINGCVAVWDKTGVLQPGFPKTTNAFFGDPALSFAGGQINNQVFDPRALYDWVNNRFIVISARCRNNCFTGTNVSLIDIAVSQTSDPRGAWNVYHLNLVALGILNTGNLADFPTLGQNRAGIYVAFNDFPTPISFSGSKVLLLPKAQIYAGAPIGAFNLFSTNTDTIQPANVMNKADSPRAEFFVSSLNFLSSGCGGGCSALVIFAVSNPLDVTGPGPEASLVLQSTANTFFFPPAAQQPGCSSGPCLIDTGDVRISGEVTYAAGLLYGALTTNGTSSGTGTAHHLWFSVRPFLDDNGNGHCTGSFLNKCPDIIASQEINEVCFACKTGFSDPTGSTYYPTVQPDPEGNVTIVFNYSDHSTFFPESRFQSNRVTQLRGTQHDSGFVLQPGLAMYNTSSFTSRNRWGDYTATAPDLTIATSPAFWFAGESSRTATSYRTAIGRNAYTGAKQP